MGNQLIPSIPVAVLNKNFDTDRQKHLELLKTSFQYVFHHQDKDSDESLQLRNSILEMFHACNYQVNSSIFNNTTDFIITALNMENYWVVITDSSNKQIIYVNPSAKVFLYDTDRNLSFCRADCSLLNQLVALELTGDMEHHIDFHCTVNNRQLSSDSFVFNWNGKDSILHFVSDNTNQWISESDLTIEEKHTLLNITYTDLLTATYNRRHAFDVLNHLVYEKQYFSVVLLNVNNIEYINDTYGRGEGDAHLVAVANIARGIIRESDMIARVGGDDFLLLFANCNEIDATSKMREIRASILSQTKYGNLGACYSVKEITPENTMEVASIIEEIYKKMNFYRQLLSTNFPTYTSSDSVSPELLPGAHVAQSVSPSIDYNFNLPNYTQFEDDKTSHCYDKICIIRIENADITIALSGSEHYYNTCREALPRVIDLLDSGFMTLYAFDYKTFMIACSNKLSDDKFIVAMRKHCDQFSYTSATTASNLDMIGVSRFAVVTQTESLVETGLSLLIDRQHEQSNFLVYDNSSDRMTISEESEIINTIRSAIVSNYITPFYQGIRNNKTGVIDTYEALMRIVDEDGKIYTPFHFLDIAKKYKFYERLTYLMIGQVLKDFHDRTERVSVNVTTSDIMSVHFRNWFYDQLEQFPNPKRLILEIVESEDYTQDGELNKFIERIRSYGVKIAIDDFGSGYSNLGKIINLKPDIIKIDGSIIQNICTDPHSQQVLDVIVSMSKILDAYIVAEYIETDAIQSIIDKFGIACSQGYLYSKPTPFEQLLPSIPEDKVT